MGGTPGNHKAVGGAGKVARVDGEAGDDDSFLVVAVFGVEVRGLVIMVMQIS